MKQPVVFVEPLPRFLITRAVHNALEEDMGRAGDITTAATVRPDAKAQALLVARESGRISGLDFCKAAFHALDHSIDIAIDVPDGANVEAGETVAIISGPARPILSAERVALNFLGHLSGIASATARLVDLVGGTHARVTCTRKTTPGLRALQKYAVRCGGGHNHRFALDDGILIKDNHIVAAGGITSAIQGARRAAGHMVRIEVEVDRLDQLDEALAAGANAILLDNMSLEELREAVSRTAGRAMLEASGNIGQATIAAVAATGVDLVSSGAITHSSRCLDLGLDFRQA
jgi:nicotinate-nucleotide pyrophosphorylase (carboxylating)